jgi:hypothetical protein
MAASRPFASDIPPVLRVHASERHTLRILLQHPVRIFAAKTWDESRKLTAHLARCHPLYSVILRGQSSVRRSTEAVVRRLEDILAWEVKLRTAYPRNATTVIEKRLRRGQHRRQGRLYGFTGSLPPAAAPPRPGPGGDGNGNSSSDGR